MDETVKLMDEQTHADIRFIETDLFHRKFSFEQSSIDADARTVNLAFSSEEPVERFFGSEVLDHQQGAVRLGRLKNRAPLLVNHDLDSVVGVVEDARIDTDKTGRAVVRFGRSVAADEVFNDVQDGIRSQVSVGYRIHEMEVEEKGTGSEFFRVTDWEPFELSLVSIGADQTVGVGRSNTSEKYQTKINDKKSKMENIDQIAEQQATAHIVAEPLPVINYDQIRGEVQKSESIRMREIEAYGSQHDAKELATEYIREGRSVAEFQTAILHMINTRKPEEVHAIGLTEKETKQFSWMNLIRALANPQDKRLQEMAAFEFETSRAQADKSGLAPQGAWVPSDVVYGQRFQTRDLTAGTDSQGGYAVQTDVLASSFVELLREALIFTRLGVRTMDGLNGQVSIPTQASTGSAYWVAESGAVTESDPAFGQVALTGKTVGAMVDISRNLMLQSSIDVEAFVRTDIALRMANQIEVKGLQGDGTSNTPTGILNTTSVGTETLNAANVPNWSDIGNIWKSLSSNNAYAGNLGWATNAGLAASMMTTERASNTAQFILNEPGAGADFSLLGKPFVVTENCLNEGQTTHGRIYFGNWGDLVMASWGNGLDLVVDPFTGSSSGTTRIVGLYMVDFGVRHAKSFCVSVNP